MPSTSLAKELRAYGVQKPTLLAYSARPELIDYLDLLPSQASKRDEEEVLPEAVAERQGRPLLYVVNRARMSNAPDSYDRELRQIRRTLGSRGEQAYLGILKPGQLSVMPLSLEDVPPEAVHYRKGTGEALTFFSRLSLGDYDGKGEPGGTDYVFEKMFELLEHIAGQLVGCHHLDKNDVLSLIGRALFFRFLCDRKVVKPQSLRSIAPKAENLKACFDDADSAASMCAWLDRTFNGDFLPLTDHGNVAFFERLRKKTGSEVFSHLSAILQGHEPAAGANYQQVLNAAWARFDFAHVPVGLLSQVYEAFSRSWSPDARQTSVHYTPRRIADYLVEEAFADLPNAASARVLDPACGAGVFLVLAFRRLYQARWTEEGRRPDTAVIRSILENQLAGFEVSEPALRLTALSLYLTAIELDPEPTPPSKLGFRNLRDRVLFNCRKDDDPKEGPVLGSLGDHVDKAHNGAYDLVLSNPPWTSLKARRTRTAESAIAPSMSDSTARLKARNRELADEYTRISREVLAGLGLDEAAKSYRNPGNVPDLPFVWRSMEWCRPGGRIGMVLPGRILFKQEEPPRRAREALFSALAINGILNCSNLTDTPVWPDMSQPFLLVFAENRRPDPGHHLRWVTPHCDLRLNRRGEVRVDSKSVELVALQSASAEPWLWKTLTIGTSLDVEVIRKVKRTPSRPFLDYWEKDLKLRSSNGYQIKRDQVQQDATYLSDLPDLWSASLFRFRVEREKLERFERSTAYRPRKRDVYRGPLTLVLESPRENREDGLALLSIEDVAYNQRFNGYSAYGHSDGELLARYLHIFIHSRPWMHYALMTSPVFGTERRVLYKDDLDESPFIPLERLSEEERRTVFRLSERLIDEDLSVFKEIDMFVCGLYGLNKDDISVIDDTLDTCLPFKKTRERACERPTRDRQEGFAAHVGRLLRPFLRKLGKEVRVSPWENDTHVDPKSPYSVIVVETKTTAAKFEEQVFRDEVLPLASESGASLVIVEVKNGLAVAILNQYRYWTPSRARLCASEILLRHMHVFEQ